MARKEAGPKSTGNLFEGPDGQAATVAGARLGKQACHENSHGVEVSNDDERTRRPVAALEVAYGHPESQRHQGLQALVLFDNVHCRVYLTGVLQGADEVLDMRCVFPVAVKARLGLVDLL
ncbi:hypothetical protein VFPBJ_11135 [Purpureocillium lilacinum]|uniref:Uncharacterized protein n=1 Tax=Purpureocillium lilacinum TaxID=33203 RepID=A0A179FJM5_PURLI|nr:hypothetical protein VFPBJ_11135 [Purpureocillium lilacinum]